MDLILKAATLVALAVGLWWTHVAWCRKMGRPAWFERAPRHHRRVSRTDALVASAARSARLRTAARAEEADQALVRLFSGEDDYAQHCN